MIRLRRLLPAVLLLLCPYVSVSAQTAETPPLQWPRSHDYDVQHYKIKVSFDWAKREVSGRTTIVFRPFKSDFRELELDAGDMNIESVKLANDKPLKFRYEENQKLFVALDRAYAPEDQTAVTID